MHDPMTQAFSIGRWITIWHVDPLKFEKNQNYCRDDDSCGWFTRPYSDKEKEEIEKLARSQYWQIFSRQVAEFEGKSYAYICKDQDCLGAIYWSWRAIKHLYNPSGVWQWGCKITASEWEHIYSLATCPVDNLEYTFKTIKNEEDFVRFFLLVFQAYLRHSRPFWKHPKWHFWHWEFQIHPLQQFKRWAFSRCGTCGKRFNWGYSPTTHTWNNGGPNWFKNEHDVHHSECLRQEVK